MTTNEIIAMAEQAGYPHVGLKWNDQEQAFLMRFAALVAAKEREAWRNALQPVFQTRMGAEQVREAVQAAIRARSAKLEGKT